MRYLFLFILLTSGIVGVSNAQVRVVDSLTTPELSGRNPVILRSELDSLFQVYHPASIQTVPQQAIQPVEIQWPLYASISGAIALLLIALLLYLLFRNQQKFNRTVYMLHKQIKHLEALVSSVDNAGNQVTVASMKGKATGGAQEKKVQYLTTQLEQVRKEVQEYELLKQQMMQIYKIRNYPGFTKEKTEAEILKEMLETERSVVLYAYEHFLKPVIAIADANKNNPAKISAGERERMLDLLISLSLLYSEYLYLRVGDLSIGGKMVERIAAFRSGNGIDLTLLKELNTEHGSRALALRMALDKMGIQKLSYPVFDETNLNLS